MRGQERKQTSMLVLRSPEDFVPKQHPHRNGLLMEGRGLPMGRTSSAPAWSERDGDGLAKRWA